MPYVRSTRRVVADIAAIIVTGVALLLLAFGAYGVIVMVGNLTETGTCP